jgi:hypothetical protein
MRSVMMVAAVAFVFPASAQGVAPQGPAYQYEGKWMAQVQTASGTLIETAANCADPITLVADSAGTLRRTDGVGIRITPVDGSTYVWEENGRSTVVIPERNGSFMALTHYDTNGRLDPGRVVFYLRCGTAGATAATQICVAE